MANRPCPHCGEKIQNAATMCRFCRQAVEPAAPVPRPEGYLSPGAILGSLAMCTLVISGIAWTQWREIGASNPAISVPPTSTPSQSSTIVPPTAAKTENKPEKIPDEEDAINRLLYVGDGKLSDADRLQILEESKHNTVIDYAKIKKNSARYMGKAWTLYGVIAEIHETEEDGEPMTTARVLVATSYAGSDEVVYVTAPFRTDFVENSIVDVLGVLNRDISYTSQAGWNITIPGMIAVAIVKHGGLAKWANEANKKTAF